MTHHFHMKQASDIKFPALAFSPIATSSPKLTKMRKFDRSWASSNSSDSIGNVTDMLAGVDESNIKGNHESMTSVHTALEYVPPGALGTNAQKVYSRAQLKTAIFRRHLAEYENAAEAEFYSTVATERILWDACATWKGSFRTVNCLATCAAHACEDWYISATVKWCGEELSRVSPSGLFDYDSISSYLHGIAIQDTITERVFQSHLVRQSSGDYLETVDVLWLMFATVGMDEKQSFEYWFRVLDVQSDGVLSLPELSNFYSAVVNYLKGHNVTALPFDDIVTQFIDILGTDIWTLAVFKKNPRIAGRVLVGFTNALRFFEQETDEKMNGERADDETFGRGERTQWQRWLDHNYDNFYAEQSSSEEVSQ